jgi:hypothetical protein
MTIPIGRQADVFFDWATMTWRLDNSEMFTPWSGLHGLTRLRGLKKVVIGNKYFADLGMSRRGKQKVIVAKIEEYLRNRRVKIVFEE